MDTQMEIKSIVYEWDTAWITVLLWQTEIGKTMRNIIEKLGRKKSYVIPPLLFYTKDTKTLLQELNKIYSIAEINDVIVEYILYINEDSKIPQFKDYYSSYSNLSETDYGLFGVKSKRERSNKKKENKK